MFHLEEIDPIDLVEPEQSANSLFLFDSHNAFRKLCLALEHHWLFQWTVFVCTFASCIVVAVEAPSYTKDGVAQSSSVFAGDMFLTVVFLLEMLIKVVARGFLFGSKGCYLRSRFTSWLTFRIRVSRDTVVGF